MTTIERSEDDVSHVLFKGMGLIAHLREREEEENLAIRILCLDDYALSLIGCCYETFPFTIGTLKLTLSGAVSKPMYHAMEMLFERTKTLTITEDETPLSSNDFPPLGVLKEVHCSGRIELQPSSLNGVKKLTLLKGAELCMGPYSVMYTLNELEEDNESGSGVYGFDESSWPSLKVLVLYNHWVCETEVPPPSWPKTLIIDGGSINMSHVDKSKGLTIITRNGADRYGE